MTKVVLITGGTKGIGAATSLAFAQAGYDVIINYHNDSEQAQHIAQQIEALGQKALVIQADAFSEAGIRTLFETARRTYPKLDVLVNNAGRAKEPSFGSLSYDNITAGLNAGVGAAILCSQYAVEMMDEGSILFTSSIYGQPFGGHPNLVLYSAAKAAMINVAQTLAERLAPSIRCNVVSPGNTLTPARANDSPEYIAQALDMTLLKEWVDPQEIASAFVFLAETPHITAQVITIDAGWQKKSRS